MSDIDDNVKDWLRAKFLSSQQYDPKVQGLPEHIKILEVDAGWHCGCYSSWTREDGFLLTATLVGASGHPFTWSYGRWSDFPSFIYELDEYINGDRDCPYEYGSEEDY